MSVENPRTNYVFIDSAYRNRNRWPHPMEFEVNSTVSSDDDLILKGAMMGWGTINNGQYDEQYPKFYAGFNYTMGYVYQPYTNKFGTSSFLAYNTDYGLMYPYLGIYSNMFIDIFDHLNPTVQYGGNIHQFLPDYVNFGMQVVLKDAIPHPADITGYLFVPRYYGPALIHGTITDATEDTLTLFPGALLNTENNFYQGKYLLIVDTRVNTGSGRYENINRIYTITEYSGDTLKVKVTPKFKFIPSPGTLYEILDLYRKNEGSLSVKGNISNTPRTYDVMLIQLGIPAGILKFFCNSVQSSQLYRRGDLREVQYLLVELSNESFGTGQNTIMTNNPYASKAVFVVFIREDENPRAARTILYSPMIQTVNFKLNDNIKISIKKSSGELLVNMNNDELDRLNRNHDGSVMFDRYAPFPPDPNLQVSLMFSFVAK